jgi:hypothetical protein
VNADIMLMTIMLKRPVVVVFVGPVESGKTTHLRLACSALRRMVVMPYCVDVKTRFIVSRPATVLGLYKLLPGVYRVCVAPDLLLNSVLIPLLWLVRTLVLLVLVRRRVMLVEEGLFGSVVVYFLLCFCSQFTTCGT